ncbi:MAG: GumC family protein [Nitrospiraceae bacterium]
MAQESLAPTDKDLRDLLGILHRRKIPMLIGAGIILSFAVTVAFMLPAVYRSTATILIEEQEIPPDLVRSAITTYADQRIETIKQQVMTRSTLWKIVEQYGLYIGLRKRSPTEEILDRFAKDIHIEVINAKVVDKRTQNPTQATIAFTLAYDGESPELSQKVANELTSLFLGENLRTRERHAQETTSFLKQEAQNLGRHIEELEQKIATVKQQAEGALPELTQLNMQLLNQADRELMDIDREIRVQEDRKSYLEGELASIKPNTPIIAASGERILDSGERLKALRAQYASSASYLSSEHPDIIKMKQEIEALEKETGSSANVEEVAKRLSGERGNLASLRDRYGNDHPDVIRSRQMIASLEHELRQHAEHPMKTAVVKPENPAFINLQAQLSSTRASLQALKATRVGLKKRGEEYSRRLEKTPQVEPNYLDLTRDRDGSALKYQEIRSRLLEAQVSEGLEIQRKGERFSLIDPPDLPEKPEKPNRLGIVFLGIILAIAGGIGGGAAVETLDHSVRTAEQLSQLTHAFPLAVIPYIPNEADLSRLIKRRTTMRWGSLGIVVVLVLLSHFYWWPLDVVWYSTLRKLGLT